MAPRGNRVTIPRIRTFYSSEEGAAMVEFAVAGAVFLLIFLGILNIGLTVWERNNLTYAAREGSRYAVVRGANSLQTATPTMIADYVKSRTQLKASGLRVYTTWNPIDKKPGSVVAVSVARDVPQRGPFLPAHTDSVTSKLIIYY